MKAKLIFLSVLLLAISASARKIEFDIPQGPGLTLLGKLCVWLRADPEIHKPNMTDNECAERFFKRGAFAMNHEKKLQELRAAGGALLDTEDAAFWAALPMPPPGPTASPTASPTVSPTVSPTATPTPAP